MHTLGIICEYNPLHKGHAYHLASAGERGLVVCLMSGNFTQRGEAAILPPVPRAAMAVAAGADLVLELPFPYAAASARYFATAGVRALAALGCDTLTFGSESADASALLAGAKRLLDPDFEAKRNAYTPDTGDAAAHFATLGECPASNDILALEYARAVLAEGHTMDLLPVKRVGAAYRDTDVECSYPSATALRSSLARGEDIVAHIPPDGVEIFRKAVAEYGLADTARLGSAMLAALRAGRFAKDSAECGVGLAAHLVNAAGDATDYASLCRAAATKRYTDGRIRRALLCLLAGVKREDLTAPPAYLRLLAANARGREYLAKTRKTRTVPVVTKQSEIVALGDAASRARALSAVCDGLYALCLDGTLTPARLTTWPPLFT